VDVQLAASEIMAQFREVSVDFDILCPENLHI
jgi:hypothetical protein